MGVNDTIPALIEKGDALLQAGDVKNGLLTYDAVLALAPKNKEALVGKAEALLRLGRPDEASRYLDYATRHHPDDSAVWRFLGMTALAAGQGGLAVTAFSNYQRLSGASAESFLNLAVGSYFDLDINRARNFIELALIEDPQNQEAKVWEQKLEELDDRHSLLVDVGRAHCRQGRLEQGLELLSQSLELQDSFPARLYTGRAFLALGQSEAAIPHLQAALETEPDNQEAMLDLAAAYSLLDQNQLAEQTYDRILSVNPNNTDALLGKGELLLKVGKLDQSEDCIERTLGLAPGRPDVSLLKAQLLYQEGKLSEARLYADHAIALDPNAAAAWGFGARVLQASDENALASLYLEMVRQLVPSQAELAVDMSGGDLKEASAEVAELDALIQKHSECSWSYRDRAVIYCAIGELERSRCYLDIARDKSPEEEEELVCQCGALLLNLRRFEEAQECFEQALAINPDNTFAQRGAAAVKGLLEKT